MLKLTGGVISLVDLAVTVGIQLGEMIPGLGFRLGAGNSLVAHRILHAHAAILCGIGAAGQRDCDSSRQG